MKFQKTKVCVMLVLPVFFALSCSKGTEQAADTKKSEATRDEILKPNIESSYAPGGQAVPKENPKIDALFDIGGKMAGKPSAGKGMGETGKDEKVRLIIKTSKPETTRQNILKLGGEVGSVVGSVITATLKRQSVAEVSSWPEVIYIESSRPMTIQDDLANADTGVDIIQAGLKDVINDRTGNEPVKTYDGKGVIIGLIDSGIDLEHPAFTDEDGKSRVLFVWDQTDGAGPGPREIFSGYGTECDTQKISSGSCDSTDTSGHGTHVAGIAAGRDPVYMGVAPAASLIVVKYLTDDPLRPASDAVCDGANYIFKKADSLGRPAVINISSGSNFGAHDGTSLLDDCLNVLTREKPGRAIVVAAGNSGRMEGGMHAGSEVTAGKNKSVIIYPNQEMAYFVDIWERPGCDMGLAAALWDKDTGYIDWSGWVGPGSVLDQDYPANDPVIRFVIDRRMTSDPLNGKANSLIVLEPKGGFDISKHFFSLVFSGSCGRFDAWMGDMSANGFSSFDAEDIIGIEYVSGDNASTVSTPATAANVLAVGSYNTRLSWTDMDGITHNDPENIGAIGSVSNFSGRGPAVSPEQGVKPNIVAPGGWIISALSFALSLDDMTVISDLFRIMYGTSMASPHAAGVVALMFQANPQLTGKEIIDIIQSTASGGSSGPSSEMGYGKVNAAGAVGAVAFKGAKEPDKTPVETEAIRPDESDDRNPETFITGDKGQEADITEPQESQTAGAAGGCSLIRQLYSTNSTFK